MQITNQVSKMQVRHVLVLLFVMVMFPSLGYPQPTCVAPALSDQQVKDIIDKERVTRTDLPRPFPKYKWIARRQGCHYVYIEYGLPEVFDNFRIFKLNQYGAIVDADTSSLKCPDKVFTESELAEIIKKEREKRADLPAPFPNYKTRIGRARCLYRYFEYALPETRGNYQVFRIDPFGELMEFSRGQPY
ncbi:MAG: hypothetical protein ACREBU_17180 [Nitrososphaera sp.]